MKAGLILLAGGKGLRMGSSTPKQFLPINGLPIALHSLAVFDQIKEIRCIVVVSDTSYHSYFPGRSYAPPGVRRQDSVWNGLQMLDPEVDLVCVHDAARPFVTKSMIEDLLLSAEKNGASAVAMPLKFTVKEVSEEMEALRTPDRSKLWEIQTPQAVQRNLLEKGFAVAFEKGITVTDDVSLPELFGHKAQLVPGSPYNIKITTPEDLEIGKLFYEKLHHI